MHECKPSRPLWTEAHGTREGIAPGSRYTGDRWHAVVDIALFDEIASPFSSTTAPTMSTYSHDNDMADADADLFSLVHGDDVERIDIEEFHCPGQKGRRFRVRKDWKRFNHRD